MSTEVKIILIIVAVFLVLLSIVLSSRSRIKKMYKKYLVVGNQSNLSGQEFAALAINHLGLGISLGVADGELIDAYAPKQKMLIMSREVCNYKSLASLTIVAHELGHALQDNKNDPLFHLCQIWDRLNKFLKKFFIPCLIASLIFAFINAGIALTLLWIAIGIFGFNITQKLLTIPLEYNASKRGLWILKEYHYLSPSEIGRAKKLLSVAAQTYIASLFDGIIIFGHKLNRLFDKQYDKKKK